MEEVFIISGMRTPMGSFCGSLSSLTASQMGSVSIKAAIEQAHVSNNDVDEVIMGNVLSAGVGQNPARQAAIHAGLPVSVGATTVNKVCGSGMKAVLMAGQSIQLGQSHVVVAGGMESMSRAPYLLPKARQGYRMGNGELVDSMIYDGLWDIYGNQHMGSFGDLCALKCEFSREAQDDFALESYAKARRAVKDGAFGDEIVPVVVEARGKKSEVLQDEEPTRFDPDKLRNLRPAFGKDGTVTAGNASTISDGAAALVLASGARCASFNLKPVARIVGGTVFSREPEWFTLAPISAVQQLMDQINWSVAETDLFEINEAFAVVAMAAQKELNIPDEKLNIHGGAVALGHPIGCSGARLLVTLINALKHTGGKRGIACLCIGGGEAIATAVELV